MNNGAQEATEPSRLPVEPLNEPTAWSSTFSIIVGVSAFIGILAFFVAASFVDTKSTLPASSALAPGLLGAFINPPATGQRTWRIAWYALVLFAFAATAACAIGFFWPGHSGAGGAVVGAAVGVVTVLTDTSALAKPLSSLAASAKSLAARARP